MKSLSHSNFTEDFEDIVLLFFSVLKGAVGENPVFTFVSYRIAIPVVHYLCDCLS